MELFFRKFIWKDIFFFEMLLSYLPFLPFIKPRKRFWFYLPLCLVAGYCFSHFVPSRISGMSTATWFFYNSFWYLSVAAILAFGVKVCFDLNWWNTLFFGTSAYAIQHVFFRLKFGYEYIYRTLSVSYSWLNYLSYWTTLVVTLFLAYLLLAKKYMLEPNFKVNNRKMVITSLFLIVVTIGASQLVAMSTRNYRDISAYLFIAVTLLSVICCYVTLDNLFGNAHNTKVEEENKMIRLLWARDRKQYELSKQNIEFLNIKYHDLKYQLGLLLNKDGKSSAYADEILSEIHMYESFVKTENETLDIVLTEKSMTCNKYGIKLACIADGSVFDKFSESDIYSFFGNALDNAIECLKDVCDDDKKIINLNVSKYNSMGRVCIENYVETEPTIVEGIPRTIKKDTQNHGFGVKSMKYLFEKYNGELRVCVKDHTFILEGVFPL